MPCATAYTLSLTLKIPSTTRPLLASTSNAWEMISLDMGPSVLLLSVCLGLQGLDSSLYCRSPGATNVLVPSLYKGGGVPNKH